MARKRPSAHTLNRLRDAHRIASGRVSSLLDDSLDDPLTVLQAPSLPINHAVRSNPLLEVEDRRRWEPNRLTRPVRSSRRWNIPVRLVRDAPRSKGLGVRFGPPTKARKAVARNVSFGGLKFRTPRYVAVCVRRKSRREVLHALKKVGAGNSRHRRRNALSNIRC